MRTLFLLTCVLLVLSSCAPRYVLDKAAIEKYALSSEDLQHIQFYNSEDIVLTHYAGSTAEKTTEKGTLNFNYGKQMDQVVIKAGTPGKVVKVLEENRLAISFEPDPDKFLVFGPVSGSKVYHLQALEWRDNRGKISYDEVIYHTNSGADHCFLRFKLKKEYEEDKRMRIAKGNKVQ